MYPQTPPTFWFFLIYLYILCRASASGLRPTSNNTAYLGLSYRQKPLKNQLWDDNFPLFLYLTHKNRFINVKYWLSSVSSYSSSCSVSIYLDYLSFVGNLSIPCLTFTRYDVKYAKSSRVSINYWQYFYVYARALIIIGLIFLKSLAY